MGKFDKLQLLEQKNNLFNIIEDYQKSVNIINETEQKLIAWFRSNLYSVNDLREILTEKEFFDCYFFSESNKVLKSFLTTESKKELKKSGNYYWDNINSYEKIDKYLNQEKLDEKLFLFRPKNLAPKKTRRLAK